MRAILLIFTIVIVGCNKKQNNRYYRAPAVLDSLAKQFVRHAAERGHSIDLGASGLTLQFGKLESTENGQCDPSSFPKNITIDSTKWKLYSPAFKEYIVYHELAHCLLNRKHIEDNVLELGQCRSWMRKDNGQCSIDFLSKSWRAYYIDELFYPDLPKPNWYRTEEKLIPYPERKKIKSIQLNSYRYIKDSISLYLADDWIIEARLNYRQQEPGGGIMLLLGNVVMQGSYKSLYPIRKEIILETSIERFDPSKSLKSPQVFSLFFNGSSEPSNELLFAIQKRNRTVFFFINHQLKHCMEAEGWEKYIELYFSMNSNSCTLEIFQLN